MRFPEIDADAEDSITFIDSDREQGHTTRTELDARLHDGAHSRIVAEVGPCRRVNGRVTPSLGRVRLERDRAPDSHVFSASVAATATVFGPIPPSESVWLPIPLSRGVKCSGARVRRAKTSTARLPSTSTDRRTTRSTTGRRF